uniref:Putative secreted protein n=1 Tax=Ixodes ricinus TaxID=34613 RepID=A0A6B0UNI1_IXORI
MMPLMVRVSSSSTAARALFCSLARPIICCVSSGSKLTKTSPSWYGTGDSSPPIKTSSAASSRLRSSFSRCFISSVASSSLAFCLANLLIISWSSAVTWTSFSDCIEFCCTVAAIVKHVV